MMMRNYDHLVEINPNLKWPYRILIIDGSGSGKTKFTKLNLKNKKQKTKKTKLKKNQQPDFDKIYLYAKDPFESKYQFLINREEKVEIKKLKNPKAFIDYSQAIDDAYENLESFNPMKK